MPVDWGQRHRWQKCSRFQNLETKFPVACFSKQLEGLSPKYTVVNNSLKRLGLLHCRAWNQFLQQTAYLNPGFGTITPLDSSVLREFYSKMHLEPSRRHLCLTLTTPQDLKEQSFCCCCCFLFRSFSSSQFAQFIQTSVHLTFIYLRITKSVDFTYLFQKNQIWPQYTVQYMKAHNQIPVIAFSTVFPDATHHLANL